MNGLRFDGLARSLGHLIGRRQSMRLVAASLLAAGSGLASLESNAKKRKRKKKKKKQPTCAQLCPGAPSACTRPRDRSSVAAVPRSRVRRFVHPTPTA